MTTAGYNIAGGQGPVAAHSHRPTPAALKMIGDALWCAGVVPCDASVLNPSNRVRVHFDVGIAYPSYEGGDPTDDYAERYIIRRAALAKGGESIPETVCAPPQECQFPAYPGTVSWKTGFDLHRDAPVGPEGEALTLEEEAEQRAACLDPDYEGNCRIRFDRNRKDIFHYGLYAHARGVPKSLFACLDGPMGQPTGFKSEGGLHHSQPPLPRAPEQCGRRRRARR